MTEDQVYEHNRLLRSDPAFDPSYKQLTDMTELGEVLVGTGMHSRTLMEWVLRIMANLLRPDELGPAEAVYRSVAALARVAA